MKTSNIKKRTLGFTILIVAMVMSITSGCHTGRTTAQAEIAKTPFGQVDGVEVDLYTIRNKNGIILKITNYGATITSLVVPDQHGGKDDIVCGFDSIDGYFSKAYLDNAPYFGGIVGRYAGRIKDGKFTVDGTDYQVAKNNAPNHLHGGIKGFDKYIWDATIIGHNAVQLSLTSPDGDEGYPGKVDVKVVYTLTDDNTVEMIVEAKTDKATPLSLTNHTYFNLGGFKDRILNHTAMIASDKFLVPDETNVPVGEEFSVVGSVWDYNSAKPIGNVFVESEQGFETYYVFNKASDAYEKVAQFADDVSGRKMEVFSSEPGMLFYTCFYTSDELKRENGDQFGQFRAFCCETSKYPNGPNIQGAPASLLREGNVYQSKTAFKLSW